MTPSTPNTSQAELVRAIGRWSMVALAVNSIVGSGIFGLPAPVAGLVWRASPLAVLLAGWRQLRPSYIAYMALSILIPMSTSSLMSMPRFALVLFPMFAILARWGERPAVNNLIVALSLPLLGLFTVLFADWSWVA